MTMIQYRTLRDAAIQAALFLGFLTIFASGLSAASGDERTAAFDLGWRLLWFGAGFSVVGLA